MLRHQLAKQSRLSRRQPTPSQSRRSSLQTKLPLWCSDVRSSRPKWTRGQNFGLGLGLKDLASALKLWWPRPRSQTFGLGLASISLSYYVIGHFSGKNHVKFRNFVNFSAIILDRMLLIITWYFFIIIFGLGLGLNSRNIGLGLKVLASFNITALMQRWPPDTGTDDQSFSVSRTEAGLRV